MAASSVCRCRIGPPVILKGPQSAHVMTEGVETLGTGRLHAPGITVDTGHCDGWVRLLQRLVNDANAKLWGHMFLKVDRPKLPLNFVGRIARPKFGNDGDGFSHQGS